MLVVEPMLLHAATLLACFASLVAPFGEWMSTKTVAYVVTWTLTLVHKWRRVMEVGLFV
jgi:hypothetical protein